MFENIGYRLKNTVMVGFNATVATSPVVLS